MRKATVTMRAARARPGRPGPAVHTRSFACPDDLWREIEAFAARRDLGSASDAARLLLRSGLHTERVVADLAAVREWQIAEAWADAQAIARGDRTAGSWAAITRAAEQARGRIRERAAGRETPARS